MFPAFIVLAILSVTGGAGYYLLGGEKKTCTVLAAEISRDAHARGQVPIQAQAYPVPGLDDTAEMIVFGSPDQGSAQIHFLIPNEISSAIKTLQAKHGFITVDECVGDTGSTMTHISKTITLPRVEKQGA